MSTSSSVIACISPERIIPDYPIGNVPLKTHHQLLLEGTAIDADPHAWLDPSEIASFIASPAEIMVDESGEMFARKNFAIPSGIAPFVAMRSFLIRQPWDLLRANEQHAGSLTEGRIDGEVHASAVVEGVIHLGPGTRILPGVFIEGNAVIGANCKIGPNCYIRGNTSIGDNCHIGQAVEIKNCLILSKTNVGHLSYVGDSVLGAGVNFGAGTITSNLRHDGRNHRTMTADGLIDTGRRKFGTIVGDGVHTGIHTAIYPGRKLWPNTSTRPGEIVSRDVVADH